MLLLAFDTATPAVTVALHNGDDVVAATSAVDAMRHAELLAPSIADVLAQAGHDRHELTDVAVGVGPGPYTGLRVGVVTARTLADALGLRLHSVCSLDILAAEAPRGEPYVIAIDARRNEVYCAEYDEHGTRVGGPDVAAPGDLRIPDGVHAYGRGAQHYAGVLPYAPGPIDPDAGVLARAVVACSIPELEPEPLYLRRPDAKPPGPRKRATG